MDNFTFQNPTKIYFGKGVLSKLHDELRKYGTSVLLVYGGGSCKKSGLYDTIMNQLHDFQVVELAGVDPNPRIESVRAGVALCRTHKIDVILAVGGGSCIDCSKAIAAATYYEKDAWDLVLDPSKIRDVLPIVDVLTLAATGSEMNGTGVISNWDTNEKRGFGSDALYPKASFLDPETTYSVPLRQSAAGVADIMSHTFEQYFNPTQGAYLPREIAHGIIKTCIKYGPVVLRDPTNYEARANLMWAATMALNGILSCGIGKSWSCHPIEHAMSAYFDVTHGTGLAIITPAWMRYVLDKDSEDCFAQYGCSVWNIDPTLPPREIALLAIEKSEEFLFDTMGIERTLHEIGIDSKFSEMAQEAVDSKGGVIHGYRTLTKEDVVRIFDMCK